MPTMKTIYFKEDNKGYEMAAIDANRALRDHADKWSDKPWPNAKQGKS